MWPVISGVLAEGDAPSELSGTVVGLLDAWIADDAPLLDADDVAGPLLFDTVFGPISAAVRAPVLGDLVADQVEFQGIDSASLIDKDLRTLLGQPVEGEFNVGYCGNGDLATCSAALWAASDEAVAAVAGERGGDPSTWLAEGARTTFVPGLVPNDFRRTNRPTFQQVIEFAPER